MKPKKEYLSQKKSLAAIKITGNSGICITNVGMAKKIIKRKPLGLLPPEIWKKILQ